MESEPITARLRRPFTYDSDDSLPEAIDEEEQESLIHNLAAQNASHNASFAKTLLVLPLICVIAYVTPSGLTPLLRLLAVQSLLATAYALHAFRPEETGFPLLDAWGSSGKNKGSRSGAAAAANNLRWPISGSGRSPVPTYLPYLNLGLSAVVLLAGTVKGGGFLDLALASLPAGIYALVLAAKLIMAGVDPESELSSLKYDYKGA